LFIFSSISILASIKIKRNLLFDCKIWFYFWKKQKIFTFFNLFSYRSMLSSKWFRLRFNFKFYSTKLIFITMRSFEKLRITLLLQILGRLKVIKRFFLIFNYVLSYLDFWCLLGNLWLLLLSKTKCYLDFLRLRRWSLLLRDLRLLSLINFNHDSLRKNKLVSMWDCWREI